MVCGVWRWCHSITRAKRGWIERRKASLHPECTNRARNSDAGLSLSTKKQ